MAPGYSSGQAIAAMEEVARSRLPGEYALEWTDLAADAAIEAAHLRLRPILMTSFTFIFGVLALVYATGASAEMRQALLADWDCSVGIEHLCCQ